MSREECVCQQAGTWVICEQETFPSSFLCSWQDNEAKFNSIHAVLVLLSVVRAFLKTIYCTFWKDFFVIYEIILQSKQLTGKRKLFKGMYDSVQTPTKKQITHSSRGLFLYYKGHVQSMINISALSWNNQLIDRQKMNQQVWSTVQSFRFFIVQNHSTSLFTAFNIRGLFCFSFIKWLFKYL